MTNSSEHTSVVEDTLVQGIAAIMAGGDEAEQDIEAGENAELADLFLEELNRLWAEPQPLVLS